MCMQGIGSAMVRVRGRYRVIGWCWESGRGKDRHRFCAWGCHGDRSSLKAVGKCKCNDMVTLMCKG